MRESEWVGPIGAHYFLISNGRTVAKMRAIKWKNDSFRNTSFGKTGGLFSYKFIYTGAESFYEEQKPYLWGSDDPEEDSGFYGKECMVRFAEEYYINKNGTHST